MRLTEISMNFIIELETEKSGYKKILLVVDRYRKMEHFITITKINTENTISRFVKYGGHFHRLSGSVLSNRQSQFVLHFWTAVTLRLGMRQPLFIVFLSHIDSQTERTNINPNATTSRQGQHAVCVVVTGLSRRGRTGVYCELGEQM